MPIEEIYAPVMNRKFKKPSMEELQLQAAKIGLAPLEAEKFYCFYESKGWVVGRSPMKSWVMAMTGWKLRWQEKQSMNMHPVAQKILAEKELVRVEQRIREIKGSYESHQTMDDKDRSQFTKLASRRKELKEVLGFSV